MTLKLEEELADYLRYEAERVTVLNELDDIENGVTHVSFSTGKRERDSHRTLLWVGAAASVLVLAGLAIRAPGSKREPQVIAVADSSTAENAATETSLPPDTTSATETTLPAPLARVSLPAGAQFQGIAPSCTTVDSIVYECTIPAFPDQVSIDMTWLCPDHRRRHSTRLRWMPGDLARRDAAHLLCRPTRN
jgi:hypothetical protein